MRTGGVILCGGQSKRMGTPKAWLPFEGEPLLTRAVRMLCEAVSPVLIAAAAGQKLPVTLNVVRDAAAEQGPLQGMTSALKVMSDCEAAFVMAVDLPMLTVEMVNRVVATLQDHPECQAAVPRVDGQSQPLAAAYRLSVLPRLREHLAVGKRSLRELLMAIDVTWIDDLPAAAFRNLNTPADLK
ncbi:molybdenum cofactor guanylyltransferase [soil metagenome]